MQVIYGPWTTNNLKLLDLLIEVRKDLKFPLSVAKRATNGKIQYEGDDYWFILNAIEKINDKLDSVLISVENEP